MLKNVIVMGYGKTFDIDGRSAQRVEEETFSTRFFCLYYYKKSRKWL